LTNVAEEVEQEVMKKTKIQLVKEIMYKLPDVERKIIQYRFGIDCMKKNQQDIAKSLDISQSYVSRIERKILVKMKREYERIVV
jgi:RNA polymerase sporulation-specific sigma factor